MFGSFFSGDLYFGKSIWGPIAPIRTNPDVDGGLIPVTTPVGNFGSTTYDSGAFTRTEEVRSEFYPVDITEEGSFIQTTSPLGTIDRIK